MVEYPVKTTSQGTYCRLEQTFEVIRNIQNVHSGGTQGLELRTTTQDNYCQNPSVIGVQTITSNIKKKSQQ